MMNRVLKSCDEKEKRSTTESLLTDYYQKEFSFFYLAVAIFAAWELWLLKNTTEYGVIACF